jgi:hypothetical protein
MGSSQQSSKAVIQNRADGGSHVWAWSRGSDGHDRHYHASHVILAANRSVYTACLRRHILLRDLLHRQPR